MFVGGKYLLSILIRNVCAYKVISRMYLFIIKDKLLFLTVRIAPITTQKTKSKPPERKNNQPIFCVVNWQVMQSHNYYLLFFKLIRCLCQDLYFCVKRGLQNYDTTSTVQYLDSETECSKKDLQVRSTRNYLF